MKNIFKVSMICALVLSLGGRLEAKRVDAPGVAIHKALTANYEDGEKDQLLADLPEAWKKQHRSIVRQLEGGTRKEIVRGAKISREREEKERGIRSKERIKEPVINERNRPASEDSGKEEIAEEMPENKIKLNQLASVMAERLKGCIKNRYDEHWKPREIESKARNYVINTDTPGYDQSFKGIVDLFNEVIADICSDDKEDTNDQIEKILKKSQQFLLELSQFGAPESFSDVVKELTAWYEKRVEGVLKKDNTEFKEALALSNLNN